MIQLSTQGSFNEFSVIRITSHRYLDYFFKVTIFITPFLLVVKTVCSITQKQRIKPNFL
ncbi:hypothetical protein THOG05_100088 [Vibrio rotiferianus]|nr:hypothetical protein THOG05_100088 [Vibrio rotiferianus]